MSAEKFLGLYAQSMSCSVAHCGCSADSLITSPTLSNCLHRTGEASSSELPVFALPLFTFLLFFEHWLSQYATICLTCMFLSMPVARTLHTSSYCYSIRTKSTFPSIGDDSSTLIFPAAGGGKKEKKTCILPRIVFLGVCKIYQFHKHWNFTRINADCQYIKNSSMCWIQALHTLSTSEKLVSSRLLLSMREAQAAKIWVVWNKQKRMLASSALKQPAKFSFLVFHSTGKEPQVSSKR